MVKHWWKKKWDSEHICGITHVRLRSGRSKSGIPYVTKLKCKHRFYTNPLLEWMKHCPSNEPTCPVCRGKFDLMDLVCYL